MLRATKPLSNDVLTRILGQISATEFFAEIFGRKPLLFKSQAASLVPIGTVALCEQLLTCDQVDFLTVRDGVPYAGPRPDTAEAHRLWDSGFTWVFREAERGDASLADLGRSLASAIHGALHLHVYRTPRSHGGFGWHFDPEDVFFFQTAGRKLLRVRENTLHPSPVLDHMPTHLRSELEPTPILEYVLDSGDWLYIPRGFWHTAQALENSVSISVGILAPSCLDALGLLMQELAKEPRWRERLAPVGLAVPLSDFERRTAWRDTLGELGVELSRRLGSEEWISKLFATTGWWARR